METLRYTLQSDGSSDRLLIPILDWLLREHSAQIFQPQWADLRHLPGRPSKLGDRVRAAVDWYPCNLLFVHRDAERQGREPRVEEIRSALLELEAPPAVCVVPVRMQEAWLLFDEMAIRTAAGNPAGREPLGLPRLDRVEAEPDPKAILHRALRTASGLGSRRRKRFAPHRHAFRIAELIDDFSPLRELSAFQVLEGELESVLADNGW